MNDAAAPAAAVLAAGRKGRVRWIICALLFAAVVLSYIDRLTVSVLKPTLQGLYHWSEGGYGDVVFWFQAAYGIGFLAFGWVVDRIGAKRGYVLAMLAWTAAHMAHALVTSTRGFTFVRIALGLGESGTYPAALAAAGAWFPKRESALAIGVFNAGANVGAIVTPLLVPAIVLAASWQAAKAGRKVGLLSSFPPTLASMPREFPSSVTLVPKLAEGAMAALDRGDRAEHDRLVTEASKDLRDCDIIEVDAEKGTLDVKLSKAELEQRHQGWKAKNPEFTSGYLWKYTEQVGAARYGAVTHPGAAAETRSYADI